MISRPYDWTYTTLFNGSLVAPESLTWQDSPEEINVPLLKQQDPILFYETIPLFEDELGDNGAATLSLRVVRFI